jgi:hypothetical protein
VGVLQRATLRTTVRAREDLHCLLDRVALSFVCSFSLANPPTCSTTSICATAAIIGRGTGGLCLRVSLHPSFCEYSTRQRKVCVRDDCLASIVRGWCVRPLAASHGALWSAPETLHTPFVV